MTICKRCREPTGPREECGCRDCTATLRRLIHGTLTDRGELSDEQLYDAIDEMYRLVGMELPSVWLIERAIDSLVSGRLVKKRSGKWDGEYLYSAQPRVVANHLKQNVLFP